VFASVEDVAYMYRPNREGAFLRTMLKGFTGVLVSDFYAAYDALGCPQQKCLIHLIRDITKTSSPTRTMWVCERSLSALVRYCAL
jgi:hypothetical protein